jgi:predicted nuclease of predicted toxin-antitoxin system
VKICDSSYLIAFLHPKPEPPKDRQDRPVTRFKERIEALIADLSAANDIIGIPTPALAETLVRSGPNRAQYMKILGDTWKFQLLPFDARAAIDAADLVAAIKTNKEKWDTWAKVKFDIQIVAIAKAEGVTLIYSDDRDIENYAKRFGIRVMRICDLPLPPPEEPNPIDGGPMGTQATLFGSPTPQLTLVTEVKPDEGSISGVPQTSQTPAPVPADGVAAESSDQLEADPAHPTPIQGSDSGRAQDEAASESQEHSPTK